MKMEEIELRKKYRYIWEDDLPYFATVERKQGARVLIMLGDKINKGVPVFTVNGTHVADPWRPRRPRGVREKQDPRSLWLGKMRLRRHPNIVAVALANKNARIAWSLLTSDNVYDVSLSVRSA